MGAGQTGPQASAPGRDGSQPCPAQLCKQLLRWWVASGDQTSCQPACGETGNEPLFSYMNLDFEAIVACLFLFGK